MKIYFLRNEYHVRTSITYPDVFLIFPWSKVDTNKRLSSVPVAGIVMSTVLGAKNVITDYDVGSVTVLDEDLLPK